MFNTNKCKYNALSLGFQQYWARQWEWHGT